MRVITKHLTKEILVSSFFVLGALVFLFGFFDLVGQASRIGTQYDWLTALQITLLDLPVHAYQVMPVAALLAGVYTLSRWASQSEFTILRISGLSSKRLALMLMVPGFLLMLATYGIGEFVAPYTDKARVEKKVEAMNTSRSFGARGYSSGIWVRDIIKDRSDKVTGHRFINVSYLISGEETRTGGWRVFEFEKDSKTLRRVVRAPQASYIPGEGWHLEKATVRELPRVTRDETPMAERAVEKARQDILLRSEIRPEILGVLTVKPTDMGIDSLYQYVEHLKENRQETTRYELTLWSRIFYPLAIFVMLAVSMPFAYLNARSGGISFKIFIGIMIGITFYAFNNIFSFIGGVNTWPPALVALAPTLIMLTATSVIMWLVERR